MNNGINFSKKLFYISLSSLMIFSIGVMALNTFKPWYDKSKMDKYYEERFKNAFFIEYTGFTSKEDTATDRWIKAHHALSQKGSTVQAIKSSMKDEGYTEYEIDKLNISGYVKFLDNNNEINREMKETVAKHKNTK